jgi:hypothetical protein
MGFEDVVSVDCAIPASVRRTLSARRLTSVALAGIIDISAPGWMTRSAVTLAIAIPLLARD